MVENMLIKYLKGTKFYNLLIVNFMKYLKKHYHYLLCVLCFIDNLIYLKEQESRYPVDNLCLTDVNS